MSKEYNCEICSKKVEMSLRALSVCPSCKRKYHELRKEIEELKDKNEILEQQNGFECGVVTELQQELAELKAKGIFPKYKIGQEIYFVSNKSQRQPIKVKTTGFNYYSGEKSFKYNLSGGKHGYSGIYEKQLFATQEEAQAALNQMRETANGNT